jgi:hypothetical protein
MPPVAVVSRLPLILEPAVGPVDKPGMAESNFLLDALNEQNLQVLRTYADRFTAAKASNRDHDGWLDRQLSSDEFDEVSLIRIHGELIAMGMLKFQLTNRNTGLQYSISDTGRETLARRSIAFPNEDEVTDSAGSEDADTPTLQEAA